MWQPKESERGKGRRRERGEGTGFFTSRSSPEPLSESTTVFLTYIILYRRQTIVWVLDGFPMYVYYVDRYPSFETLLLPVRSRHRISLLPPFIFRSVSLTRHPWCALFGCKIFGSVPVMLRYETLPKNKTFFSCKFITPEVHGLRERQLRRDNRSVPDEEEQPTLT